MKTKNTRIKCEWVLIFFLSLILAFIAVFNTVKSVKATSFANSTVTYNEGQDLTFSNNQYGNFTCRVYNTGNLYSITCLSDSGTFNNIYVGINYRYGQYLSSIKVITTQVRELIRIDGSRADTSNTSINFTITANGISSNEGNFAIKSVSGGGYTEEDIQDAYQDGYTEGYNTAEDNYQADLVGVLNRISNDQYGSDNVYTDYVNKQTFNTNLNSELNTYGQNAYNSGRLQVLNYFSDNGTETDYTTFSVSNINTEVTAITDKGKLSALNSINNIKVNIGLNEIEGTKEVVNNYSVSKVYTSYSTSNATEVITQFITNTANRIYSNISNYNYDSYDVTPIDIPVVGVLDANIPNSVIGNLNDLYNNGVDSVLNNLSNYDLYTYSELVSNGVVKYNEGYADARQEYMTSDVSLSNTAVAVASVPYVVLTSMLNFEILGVNFWLLFSGIIGVFFVLWLIKKVVK